MSDALETDVPHRKRSGFRGFLWIGIPSLLVSLAVVGFFLFSSGNSEEAKAPKQTEQDLEMQRLSSELLGVKSTADSALKKAEQVEKRQEEAETKMDFGFADLHRRLDSLDRKVEGYHKIPPRVSLPKSKPAAASASNATTRTTAAARVANTVLVARREASPTASQNSSEFVSRREFQASVDTIYAYINRLGVANLAIAVTLDSVMAKMGRLTSNPPNNRERILLPQNPPANPAEVRPAENTQSRHAY